MAYRDPRETITPDAFHVKPELLGLPLAGPYRRGAAMLLDLAFVGLILLLKTVSSALFWIGLAGVLFRASSRAVTGGVRGGTGRFLVRAAGALILLVVTARFVGDFIGSDEIQRGAAAESEEDLGLLERPGLRDIGRGVADFAALKGAETADEALPAATRLARTIGRTGATPSEVRDALLELGPDASWMEGVARQATEGLDSTLAARAASLDSLVAAYGGAVSGSDTIAIAEARQALVERASEEPVARARRRVEALEAELEEAQRVAEEGPSVLAWMRDLLDELGIGIGWTGLYFTVFTVLMSGQTPGKRIVGIRVVRLNGESIGWWTSFSRFGGYAACLFTGMLGFVETFWDPNRQGLQDKMVGTVVIRASGSAPIPTPGYRPEPGSPHASSPHTAPGAAPPP